MSLSYALHIPVSDNLNISERALGARYYPAGTLGDIQAVNGDSSPAPGT